MDDIKRVEILFDDLTKEKQQEIIDLYGHNNNWDICPIIILEKDIDDEE